MIISTSSDNVQLTDDICAYVEDTLRTEFGHVADHVLSLDARLEAISSIRGRCDMKAVVRVDLRNHRSLETEIVDDNLYAAIRRSAEDSARAVDRQLQHSRRITDQPAPAKFHAFGRYSASNL
jgi:ribosome-associated translation inhibitor RaiA